MTKLQWNKTATISFYVIAIVSYIIARLNWFSKIDTRVIAELVFIIVYFITWPFLYLINYINILYTNIYYKYL